MPQLEKSPHSNKDPAEPKISKSITLKIERKDVKTSTARILG